MFITDYNTSFYQEKQMKYKLIGSVTSPYVRKLHILLQTIAPFEFTAINYLEKDGDEYLRSINPINKIPVLFDGDQMIYDSRVIYNYLAKKHNLKALSIEEENILSAIDGAMDTSINLFSLRRGGLDINDGKNAYIVRQQQRVPMILAHIGPWLSKLDPSQKEDWNFVSISAYSYLYWGQFRQIIDLSPFPECQNFLERFKNAKGVAETNIPT